MVELFQSMCAEIEVHKRQYSHAFEDTSLPSKLADDKRKPASGGCPLAGKG